MQQVFKYYAFIVVAHNKNMSLELPGLSYPELKVMPSVIAKCTPSRARMIADKLYEYYERRYSIYTVPINKMRDEKPPPSGPDDPDIPF